MDTILGIMKKNTSDLLMFSGMIFSSLLIFLIVRILLWDYIPTYTTHVGNQDEEQFIYELEEGMVIEQEFSCSRSFDFLTLSFSDHDLTAKGKTIITVENTDTAETVFYGEFENSNINYGEYVRVYPDGGGRADTAYRLTLYEVDTGDVKLGIYGYLSDGDSPVYVNGKPTEYSLSIGMHTETGLYKGLVIFASVMLWIMLILCIFGVRYGWTEKRLFLCIAIPLGGAFLCFLSVNPVHDGSTHLAKVYHYSNMLLGWDENDDTGYVSLRADEKECFDSAYSEIYRENEQAQVAWETYHDFGIRAQGNALYISHQFRETSASSIWEYFPGVIGMTIGRCIGTGARFNILLTKLFFYSFYIIAVFLAMSISFRMKSCIAFTALLPMAVYQATGITYDSVIVAYMILIIAFWLKAREQKLKAAEWVAVAVLSYLIGCCKGGFYAIVVVLFLFVPKESFGNIKRRILAWAGICAAALAGFVTTSLKAYLPYLRGMLGLPTQSSILQQTAGQEIVEKVPGKETIAYGIMYIVREPLECLKIFLNTLFEKADYYIGSMVGYRMAWTDDLTPWFIIILFLIILIISGIFAEDGNAFHIRLKEKGVCVILFSAELAAFHLLMLIETPMGNTVINGVQGRYFIAWLPLIFLIFSGKGCRMDGSAIKRLYVFYGFAEMLFFVYYMRILFGIS